MAFVQENDPRARYSVTAYLNDYDSEGSTAYYSEEDEARAEFDRMVKAGNHHKVFLAAGSTQDAGWIDLDKWPEDD